MKQFIRFFSLKGFSKQLEKMNRDDENLLTHKEDVWNSEEQKIVAAMTKLSHYQLIIPDLPIHFGKILLFG
jgi:hypothetical protein